MPGTPPSHQLTEMNPRAEEPLPLPLPLLLPLPLFYAKYGEKVNNLFMNNLLTEVDSNRTSSNYCCKLIIHLNFHFRF